MTTFVCPLLTAHCKALSVPPSVRYLVSHRTTSTWLFIAARSNAAVVHPSCLRPHQYQNKAFDGLQTLLYFCNLVPGGAGKASFRHTEPLVSEQCYA